MDSIIAVSLDNLLSPPILFFVLGLTAGITQSDLAFPKGLVKALSIYLMISIGLKGGAELNNGSINGSFLASIFLAVAISLFIPFLAYKILRVATRQNQIDCVAIAAHYGSTSIVTFITAVAFLDLEKVSFESYFIVLLVLMEFPAILSAIYLKTKLSSSGSKTQINWKEIFFGGTTILLLGSLLIGFVIGPEGKKSLDGFILTPFNGVLCLFLLGLGVEAGQKFADFLKAGPRLLAFGIYMPLIGAVIGTFAGVLCGMSVGGTTLFAVLSASSSYIVVPAAMKISLPEANPGIYLPLSLGVTFPFNVMIGIPLYHGLAVVIHSFLGST